MNDDDILDRWKDVLDYKSSQVSEMPDELRLPISKVLELIEKCETLDISFIQVIIPYIRRMASDKQFYEDVFQIKNV